MSSCKDCKLFYTVVVHNTGKGTLSWICCHTYVLKVWGIKCAVLNLVGISIRNVSSSSSSRSQGRWLRRRRKKKGNRIAAAAAYNTCLVFACMWPTRGDDEERCGSSTTTYVVRNDERDTTPFKDSPTHPSRLIINARGASPSLSH